MMTTSGQWRGKGRVGKLLWEKLWQLAPFVSVCFPRLTGEKFAPFLLSSHAHFVFPLSRFPAPCVLTFKQFSGSQRSDNDDAGQTSSGRSKECRGAEEVGGAGGAEGAGGSAERDHGALCASVSDFVSFLTLRGGQRSCSCRHCQYFTLASFL